MVVNIKSFNRGQFVLEGANAPIRTYVDKHKVLRAWPKGVPFKSEHAPVVDAVSSALAYFVLRATTHRRVDYPNCSNSTSCSNCYYCKKFYVDDEDDNALRSVSTMDIRDSGSLQPSTYCQLHDRFVDEDAVKEANRLTQYSQTPLGSVKVWLNKGYWLTADDLVEYHLQMTAQMCPYFRWKAGYRHQLPYASQFPVYARIAGSWKEVMDFSLISKADAAYIKVVVPEKDVAYRLLMDKSVLQAVLAVKPMPVADVVFPEPSPRKPAPFMDTGVMPFVREYMRYLADNSTLDELVEAVGILRDIGTMHISPEMKLFIIGLMRYYALKAVVVSAESDNYEDIERAQSLADALNVSYLPLTDGVEKAERSYAAVKAVMAENAQLNTIALDDMKAKINSLYKAVIKANAEALKVGR